MVKQSSQDRLKEFQVDVRNSLQIKNKKDVEVDMDQGRVQSMHVCQKKIDG